MNILEAIILGIVQGLTEFLPVSSSGHLELAKEFLGIEVTDDLLFSVLLHAATALSTIVVFYRDIFGLIRAIFSFKWNEETKFVAKIVLSMIPVGLVGVFFKDQVEGFFEGHVILVGSMLIVTGVLLFLSQKVKLKDGNLTFGKAFITGIAQAVAILPGISRSGSTIATQLILGVKKETAAKFSFLMVLLPILGATALEMKDFFELQATSSSSSQISGLNLGLGFISAFVVGILACHWMIQLVKKSKLDYFALYCLLIGIFAIVYKIGM